MTDPTAYDSPDYAALLARVRADPADDLLRLVYADALEEHAGFVPCPTCDVASGVRRYATHGGDWIEDECNACSGSGRVSDGLAERAEFVRVQCELAASAGLAETRHDILRRRERELFGRHALDWFRHLAGPFGLEAGPGATLTARESGLTAEVRRGFVGSARGPLAGLMAALPGLVRREPLTAEGIAVTDRWPWETPEGTYEWRCQRGGQVEARYHLPPRVFDAVVESTGDGWYWKSFPDPPAARSALAEALLAWAADQPDQPAPAAG